MILLRAPVVVPVSRPLIEDGAVLVAEGRIRAVGPYHDLKGPAPVVEYEDRALVPSLVNAHCHLELSHLAELGKQRYAGPMTGWISKLLELRQEKEGDGVLEAGRRGFVRLEESGTGLVVDIGNLPESADIGGEGRLRHFFLLELMGITRLKEEQAVETARRSELPCTVHAPYSSGPELMKYVKKKADAAGTPFSVHLAESSEEVEFLREGTGPFRVFLEEKGLWDHLFSPPGCGAVEYLEGLELLDAGTLCVHCVQVSDKELDLLARRSGKVCLCPTSNLQLGVGRAPLEAMLERGILPALGTDSLASNPDLDIWQEMAVIRSEYPGVAPDIVFSMATRAGALACKASDLGALSPGHSASILAVDTGTTPVKEIMEYLTSGNIADKVIWTETQMPV